MRFLFIFTGLLIILMVSACGLPLGETQSRYRQSTQHPMLIAPEGVELPKRSDRFSIPKATGEHTLEGDEITRPPKLSID